MTQGNSLPASSNGSLAQSTSCADLMSTSLHVRVLWSRASSISRRREYKRPHSYMPGVGWVALGVGLLAWEMGLLAMGSVRMSWD